MLKHLGTSIHTVPYQYNFSFSTLSMNSLCHTVNAVEYHGTNRHQQNSVFVCKTQLKKPHNSRAAITKSHTKSL
jgi:hypothetical protein